MRIRKKDQQNLVKVGAFLAGLTIILMIMITSIGKENSIFDTKVDIKARVGNVSNLKPGSYVELKGIRIGTVTNIQIISDEEVEVIMTILEKELKWIKLDSNLAISTAGLVGDKFIEIHSGSKESRPFDPEKDVLRSEDQADLKKIITTGGSIASTTERILNKLELILIKLDDGQKIVGTFNALNKASINLEKVTADLQRANLSQMVGNVNKASASIDRILSRVEKGPGTANSLIYDDGVYEDLRVLLGGAQRNTVIKYFIRESIKNSGQKKAE